MRRTVNGAATAMMVALCMVWGLQQVAIKAAADISPMLQVSLRSGVAAGLVWLIGRTRKGASWVPAAGLAGGLVGFLFAAEFFFVAEGLRWTTSAHMVVLLYTAPLFAAVGLHVLVPSERLSIAQWGGVGMAFSGVAATLLIPTIGHGATSAVETLTGDLFGICAGLAWGSVIVAVRVTRLNDAPATQTLFYQLFWAFVVLLAVAVATGQYHFRSSVLAWSSLGFQTLIVSVASYLAWFWLLRNYLAARLGVLTLMTPLFGVFFGALLLGEPITRSFLAGTFLVGAGAIVVNGQGALQPLLLKLSRRNNGDRSATGEIHRCLEK